MSPPRPFGSSTSCSEMYPAPRKCSTAFTFASPAVPLIFAELRLRMRNTTAIVRRRMSGITGFHHIKSLRLALHKNRFAGDILCRTGDINPIAYHATAV